MWFAKETLTLGEGENGRVATLRVPPGTYDPNVTGEAFNVQDGDVDLHCQLLILLPGLRSR